MSKLENWTYGFSLAGVCNRFQIGIPHEMISLACYSVSKRVIMKICMKLTLFLEYIFICIEWFRMKTRLCTKTNENSEMIHCIHKDILVATSL